MHYEPLNPLYLFVIYQTNKHHPTLSYIIKSPIAVSVRTMHRIMEIKDPSPSIHALQEKHECRWALAPLPVPDLSFICTNKVDDYLAFIDTINTKQITLY